MERIGKENDYFVNKMDIILLSIAGDIDKNLRNMCGYNHIIISDLPKRTLMDEFKVKTVKRLTIDKVHDSEIFPVPITFLVNSEGIIIWKYIGTRNKRPSISIIKDAIDKYL